MGNAPDAAVALLANLIALTPGTMTVEATRSPACVYVHFLLLDDVDEARRAIGHARPASCRTRWASTPTTDATPWRTRTAVIAATYVLLALAAAGFTYRLVRGPSLADRTLGLNGLMLVLMGAIATRARSPTAARSSRP